MSIEAIAFVKTLDVDNPTSRLLLFIIGENTFNDSGLCKVGQSILVEETKSSERTVRRHIAELVEKNVLKPHPQFKEGFGREPDAIELLGFRDWYAATRSPQPAKLASLANGESSPQANRSNWPDQSGHLLASSMRPLLAGSYKDNRTSKSVQESAQAREDSNSDLKVQRSALPAIPLTKADSSWKAWVDHLRANDYAALADAAELAGAMVTTARWPKPGVSPPFVDKAPAAAKAIAERMTGGSA